MAGSGEGGAVQGVVEGYERVEDLQDAGFLQFSD